ncbi:ABC transporter permease [Ureibacillus acetophenoni]|uniref:Transport permease protein n=1 Tax=Ureibacillus acetophenoni TaxID=614649 RepID=A0A285UIX5_9BACL|nr:ABC transporter permease [Ureibacillus acetophenoni]SOC41799.1 ABC-2 type transport system permease protein [Ureibacillus acetophenoni]
MSSLHFASRNQKEILRDPLSLVFGFGLPIVLLFLFSIMQKNLPYGLFQIEHLAPGIIVFGFSFLTLFSGMLLGKDRGSSFLMRLFASPLSAKDYIIGYLLPMLPIALLQIIVCLVAASLLGLPFNSNSLLAIIVLLLISILFISFGLLFGTLFTDKQVGGIFALFVNVTAFLSGIWFSLDLIGGTFKTICYLLPFAHAVDAAKAAFAGNIHDIWGSLFVVIGYTVVIMGIAIVIFRKRMRS